MNRFLSAAILAATVSVALPATASANSSRQRGAILDRSAHSRDHQLSIFGLMPYATEPAFGAGIRYTLPLVEDGFIPPINDSFELEFGGDFAFNPFYGYDGDWYFWGAGPVVEARWTFHITPKFSAYAKLGLGLRFDFYNWEYYDGRYGRYYDETDLDVGPHHTEAIGLLLQLTDSLYLRAEAGYPDLRVGLAFDL